VAAINEEALRRESARRLPKQAATRPKDESEFAGKVALITGGTSGIGEATARRLAALGAKVVITGRKSLEGRRVASEIRRRGGSVAFLRTDLSNPEEVRLVVPFTRENFGRLDYAFNRLLVEQTEENFTAYFCESLVPVAPGRGETNDGARTRRIDRKRGLS